MPDENRNTLDDSVQKAGSGIQAGKNAIQTARDLKQAAQTVKAARQTASAVQGAKTAKAAVKAAGQAAAGNYVGAALQVAVNTKAGRAILACLLAIVLMIPVVFAMLPDLVFSGVNDAVNSISDVITLASEEAAAESTTWLGQKFNTVINSAGYFWDYIRGKNNDDNISDPDDFKAVYEENAAISSTKLKVSGTQRRVEKRAQTLYDALEEIDQSELNALCMEQSPDFNWDFSAGNSTVTQMIVKPATFSEGNALRIVAAYGTQTQDQSASVSASEYLKWVGTEPVSSVLGKYAPWNGTFMPQPIYEEMQLRRKDILGSYYTYSSDVLRALDPMPEGLSDKITEAESVEEEYADYQTALVNYIVVVEEPEVTTWEESRTRIETRTRTYETTVENEDGTTETVTETEEYEVEVTYSVGCGSVGYTIKYLSTDELSEMVGFWPNGTSEHKDEDNGPRSTSSADSAVYSGEVSADAQGIYNYLRTVMNLNPAAASGILANIQVESASTFDPTIEGDNGTSLGLCQWHNSRKTKLKTYCDANGLDYLSVSGQMAYLQHELQTDYPSVWRYLQSVDNSAQGAYDAANYWCVHFEIPADTEAEGRRRGTLARDTYWPQYGVSDNIDFGDVGDSASDNSGSFWFDDSILLVRPDASYQGHSVTNLTNAEKGAIICAINGEMGGDLDGCMLIAQEIRDAYDYFDYLNAGYAYWGTVTWEKIIKNSFSTLYWNTGSRLTDYSSYPYAYQAFQYVFEQGNSAVHHKLLGHAATYIDFSAGRPWWYRAIYYEPVFGEAGYVWSTELFGDYVNPNTTYSRGPEYTNAEIIDDFLSTVSDGRYSVAFQEIDGERITKNNASVDAGTLIDLFLAGAYLSQRESGVCGDMSDDLRAMLVGGDTDAADRIINEIGVDVINRILSEQGFSDTTVIGTYDADGTAGRTSVLDCARALDSILAGSFFSQSASDTMLELLTQHSGQPIIGSALDGNIGVISLTSDTAAAVADAAILTVGEKRYILCAIASNPSSRIDAVSGISNLARRLMDNVAEWNRFRTNAGRTTSGNARFSKNLFEDYPYYFSARFGYQDEPSNVYYWMKKAMDYGRDDDGTLLYEWDANGEHYERYVAYQDDIYYDLIEFTADYAGISLDTSNGASSFGLTDGSTLANLAEQEYGSYGGTACGNRYWGSSGPEAWCCDFVYWCADQLGYVGSEQIFGPKTAYVPDAVTNLKNAGAQIYYPGDGTVPQPGDIIFFWQGRGRPGNASDGVPYDGCHVGIVVEGTGSTVTIVEGNCGSGDPSQSVLKRNTYSLTGMSWSNTYIMLFARPSYPTISLDENDHAAIQQALIRCLYGGRSGGYISCDFDGYSPGGSVWAAHGPSAHEGIDIANGQGVAIYALIDGEVIWTGFDRNGNSYLCIYDSANNKTVTYMHGDFTVSTGTKLKRGDYVGTEGCNGAPTHTHVEVINGKVSGAKKSVGDPNLENENPYPYWAKVLSSGGGSFLRQIQYTDPNYHGHSVSLTEPQKLNVLRAMVGEQGTDNTYEIYVGEAQYIRDFVDYGSAGIGRSYNNIGSTWLLSASSTRGARAATYSLSDLQRMTNLMKAYQFVFEQGGSLIQHKCWGYYDDDDAVSYTFEQNLRNSHGDSTWNQHQHERIHCANPNYSNEWVDFWICSNDYVRG